MESRQEFHPLQKKTVYFSTRFSEKDRYLDWSAFGCLVNSGLRQIDGVRWTDAILEKRDLGRAEKETAMVWRSLYFVSHQKGVRPVLLLGSLQPLTVD